MLTFLFMSGSILGFQSPATPVMEGIIDLHNYIFFYLILVFVFIFYMFCYIMYNFYILPTFLYDFVSDEDYSASENRVIKKLFLHFGMNVYYYRHNVNKYIRRRRYHHYIFDLFRIYLINMALERQDQILYTRKINHGIVVETVWTIIPSIILVLIAVPSFALLYAMDEIVEPKLTVKAIGQQWFWTYEYAHFFNTSEFNYFKDGLGYVQTFSRDSLIYDSVMLSEDELLEGYHRLLEVDHQMILPIDTHIRLMVTAGDVLHSWSIPSLGIKVDAIPGRLSQVAMYIKREGVFYGQCSELCGVNHGFMPIVVKAVSYDEFLSWYRSVQTVWSADEVIYPIIKVVKVKEPVYFWKEQYEARKHEPLILTTEAHIKRSFMTDPADKFSVNKGR
jgi:cytochrome c oxidase subunit 2